MENEDMFYEMYEDEKENDNTNFSNLDLVGIYLNELTKNVLTYEEEQELFKKYSLGDENAKNEIIESNLRLVVSVAKTYFNGNPITFMDMIQDGNEGLIKAVEMFDYTKGYKFSTYAMWWIKQTIFRGFSNYSRTIRIPVHVIEEMNKVKKAIDNYFLANGYKPNAEEISEISGLDIDRVNELLFLIQNESCISLYSLIMNEEDSEDVLENFIYDENSQKEFSKLMDISIIDIVKNTKTINDKEKDILLRRCGYLTGKVQTLEEVGNYYGISRERVRQIEEKAIIKINKDLDIKKYKKEFVNPNLCEYSSHGYAQTQCAKQFYDNEIEKKELKRIK